MTYSTKRQDDRRSYKVIIAIKNEWWSDQKGFTTFAAAQRHRTEVAARWNDCDTAISAPDGRTLAFKESLQEQKRLADMLAEVTTTPDVLPTVDDRCMAL